MKKRTLIVGFLGILLSMISCQKKQNITYETATTEIGDISTSITATGTIEPVTQVEVGTQVSGIIKNIYVDFNSIVTEGQVIAELDKTNLRSELASAESNYANAKSSLTYQESNYNRYKVLYEKGLVSANEYESAKLSYDQAKHSVIVQQQNAQKAKTNLEYATITSPINGVILSREVEEGQTVAASMSTPTLFVIAQDLRDMRVIVNVDEADIGSVKEGQRVSFTVDAFPDDIFEGEVAQVRQQATVESNVVTYEVVVSAPNNDLKLKPGLTANITIFTKEKSGVVIVPSKALRFRPTEAFLREGESIERCKGKNKIWKKEGKVFKAYPVEIGINNGTITEIISGINKGEEIIIDVENTTETEESKPKETKQNPFMPSRGGRGKTQNRK